CHAWRGQARVREPSSPVQSRRLQSGYVCTSMDLVGTANLSWLPWHSRVVDGTPFGRKLAVETSVKHALPLNGNDPAAHSITSSARASRLSGTVSPSAFAVLRLITSWNLVGACTGRSAGFSPLRMRST